MIEFEKVLGAFSLLAELDEDAARAASPVVELAIAELASMLLPNACTADTHDRICHAAAALAYYKYVLLEATRGGFSAGDIKFNAASAVELSMAKAIRDDAFGAVYDLIDSRTFAFVQV